MKKIHIYYSLFLFVLFFTTSCGYTPIYSTSNFDLKFNKIDYTPNVLNKQIAQTLNSLSNPNSTKRYDIKINTLKEKNTVSKNSKGETVTYEIKIILELEISNEKIRQNETFSSKIKYSNNDNKFELNQYEIEIEKQITSDLIEEIILFFSNL